MAKRAAKTSARRARGAAQKVRRPAKRADKIAKVGVLPNKPASRRGASTKTAARKPSALTKATAEPPLDSRLVAAIAQALHDDAANAARAGELTAPISAWTLAGRPRRVHTPWSR